MIVKRPVGTNETSEGDTTEMVSTIDTTEMVNTIDTTEMVNTIGTTEMVSTIGTGTEGTIIEMVTMNGIPTKFVKKTVKLRR